MMIWIDSLFSAPVWSTLIFGNTLESYVFALGIFVVSLVILKLIQTVILTRLKVFSARTATDIDDLLIRLTESVRPSFYSLIALYVGIQFLTLSAIVARVINVLFLLFLIYQIIRMVGVVIEHVVQKRFSDDANTRNAARMITILTKGALWILGILLILQNAGINVTSLIAGLGIGGLAIAFALQNIFEDLFSSFAIFFDKPFEVDDFIIVGADAGVVEKVGIKTTRLRSLQGEEVVISNKELTKSRIQNFRKLEERRAVFTFGVAYETPNEKLERIPSIIQQVIEAQNKVRFDRAHFKSFEDSSLNYEVVYFTKSREYGDYMNAQQNINLGIKAQFEREGITMAYPTRTIYLNEEK